MSEECADAVEEKGRHAVLDLFAGAGGTGLGFREAGFRIVGAIELDKYAAETYEKNLGVKVTIQDIRQLSPHKFREELELAQGELDVLMGGPPCQGFSKMRNGNGNGDSRNDLILRYLKYVAEFRPRFALLENVPGLIRSSHGKEYFEALCKGLKDLGYALKQAEVDAADYGVPQHRRRVIVTAGRDHEEPPFATRTHGAPGSLEVSAGLLKRWKTVRDAIGRFPATRKDEPLRHTSEFPNHVPAQISETVERFLRAVPADGGSRTDAPRSIWLPCHLNHGGHKDVYGRAAWDRPSNTMTTGCNNLSKGRFVHPEQDRAFTAREAAALQGFPDDFVFYGMQLGRQIGNAVPPPLARAFAVEFMKRLRNHAGPEAAETHAASEAEETLEALSV